MFASALIEKELLPLQRRMAVGEAMEILNGFGLAHLPVMFDGKAIGVVSVEDIYTVGLDEPIDEFIKTEQIFRVYENIHEFELTRFFGQSNYSSLAVVDAADNFIGIVSLQNLIHQMTMRFSHIHPGQEYGGIITLEMRSNDYSLSEIGRIVESSDAKILALYVGRMEENSPMIEVSLQVDRPDVKNILASFERFSYNVKASHISEEEWAMLQERYNALMKYLNM
ncbi:MAG: CBS domain-containing protein [Flavobacteriaceae bacterium]|nr:CBS domain-containing protein [Flavobacteriaceae bacterium]